MRIRILFLACLLATAAAAQDHSLQPNTVAVGADGKYEANPDTALVQFNISAEQSKPTAAYDQASKQAEQVRQILRTNGIDPKDAQVGFFQMQPMYDYNSAKRKLTGYQVNVSVSLKLKDFSKIAPITQQLSDMAITDEASVSYTLEDTDAAKTKAVEDAYRKARVNANTISAASGRPIGDLVAASVDIQENVRLMPMGHPVMKMAPMAANVAPTEEFSPQTVSVTAHVNAVFMLK